MDDCSFQNTPRHPSCGGHLSLTAVSGPRAPGKGPPFSRGCAPRFGSHQTNVTAAGFARRRPRAGLSIPSPGDSRVRREGWRLAVVLRPWRVRGGRRHASLPGARGPRAIAQRRDGAMGAQSWHVARVSATRSPHSGTSEPPPAAERAGACAAPPLGTRASPAASDRLGKACGGASSCSDRWGTHIFRSPEQIP